MVGTKKKSTKCDQILIRTRQIQTYFSPSFLILHSVVFGMGVYKSLIYRLYGPLLVLVDSRVELSISMHYTCDDLQRGVACETTDQCDIAIKLCARTRTYPRRVCTRACTHTRWRQNAMTACGNVRVIN